MERVLLIIEINSDKGIFKEKILKKVDDKTILNHIVDGLIKCEMTDDLVVVTTNSSKDDNIVKELESLNVKYFRGNEKDALSRYYYAANKYDADVIVKLSPYLLSIDYEFVDDMIDFYLENNYDIVSNLRNDILIRINPNHLDIEIFSYEVLRNAYLNAKRKYYRENITAYIYKKYKNIYIYNNESNRIENHQKLK